MSRLFNPTGEGSTYEYNPYYNPGRCGLEILGALEDPQANYSFDTVVVWIDLATSDLYAARDSGCSCPSPFEGYHSTGDLTPVRSWEDVEGLIQDGYVKYDSADRFVLRRKVESYLGGMKLANQAVEEFREQYITPLLAFTDPGAGSCREEELLQRIEDLEADVKTARELNDMYLTVIRDQGQVLQSVRLLIGTYTDAERQGRF